MILLVFITRFYLVIYIVVYDSNKSILTSPDIAKFAYYLFLCSDLLEYVSTPYEGYFLNRVHII
jgi:hypothetical protein